MSTTLSCQCPWSRRTFWETSQALLSRVRKVLQIDYLSMNDSNFDRSHSVGKPIHNIPRRVNPEGVEMLDAKLYFQDSQFKVNALENRIKRLIFEEERAKKLTKIANQKAEKLFQSRERHERDLLDKMQRREQSLVDQERKRQINQLQKELHYQRVLEQREVMKQRNKVSLMHNSLSEYQRRDLQQVH